MNSDTQREQSAMIKTITFANHAPLRSDPESWVWLWDGGDYLGYETIFLISGKKQHLVSSYHILDDEDRQAPRSGYHHPVSEYSRAKHSGGDDARTSRYMLCTANSKKEIIAWALAEAHKPRQCRRITKSCLWGIAVALGWKGEDA